jgi:hypothetical protein
MMHAVDAFEQYSVIFLCSRQGLYANQDMSIFNITAYQDSGGIIVVIRLILDYTRTTDRVQCTASVGTC